MCQECCEMRVAVSCGTCQKLYCHPCRSALFLSHCNMLFFVLICLTAYAYIKTASFPTRYSIFSTTTKRVSRTIRMRLSRRSSRSCTPPPRLSRLRNVPNSRPGCTGRSRCPILEYPRDHLSSSRLLHRRRKARSWRRTKGREGTLWEPIPLPCQEPSSSSPATSLLLLRQWLLTIRSTSMSRGTPPA